jgi:hypothetical protein
MGKNDILPNTESILMRHCTRDDFEKVNAGHIYDSYKGNDYLKSLICPDSIDQ